MSKTEVPGTLRGIEGILITVGVGITAWIIYRNSQKNKELQQANTQAQDATQELAALQKQGITPTYSLSQFEGFSQQLVQAMNGCGTDEDQVYQVFSAMQNKADVLKLIEVFGVRYYEPCWVSQADAYAIWLFNDQAYGGGISTWLTYDMTASEIGKINSILSAKSIDYQF